MTQEEVINTSHFCTVAEYERFTRSNEQGMTFYGAFYGQDGQRLDQETGQLCLSAEDLSRGVLAIGRPGSGKTQEIILPGITDLMAKGHSLVVADLYGDLTTHIVKCAKQTGHRVLVHDPTWSNTIPAEEVMYVKLNVVDHIHSLLDAIAVAKVLIPAAEADNRFWSDSAADLLASCLLRYASLAEIRNALSSPQELAERLASKDDDAAQIANTFLSSVKQADNRIAANLVAVLSVALQGWGDEIVCQNTESSEFHTGDLTDFDFPTVLIVAYPSGMRESFGSYIGAVIRSMLLNFPMVGKSENTSTQSQRIDVVLDDFPAFGRLEGILGHPELAQKYGIGILLSAVTVNEIDSLYGRDNARFLLNSMGFQFVYHQCDLDTAECYSEMTAYMTVAGDIAKVVDTEYLLSRKNTSSPLPGHVLIFTRDVQADQAIMTVMTAQLTPSFERS